MGNGPQHGRMEEQEAGNIYFSLIIRKGPLLRFSKVLYDFAASIEGSDLVSDSIYGDVRPLEGCWKSLG